VLQAPDLERLGIEGISRGVIAGVTALRPPKADAALYCA
jgi:hypothetical protein